MKPRSFYFSEEDTLHFAGAKKKAEENLAVLHLLEELEASRLPATPAQQETLIRYTGWGVFPVLPKGELGDCELLTAEERIAAKSLDALEGED